MGDATSNGFESVWGGGRRARTSTQWPWPLHPSGHADVWHFQPVQPCAQSKSPVLGLNTPWPLSSTEQSAPEKPA